MASHEDLTRQTNISSVTHVTVSLQLQYALPSVGYDVSVVHMRCMSAAQLRSAFDDGLIRVSALYTCRCDQLIGSFKGAMSCHAFVIHRSTPSADDVFVCFSWHQTTTMPLVRLLRPRAPSARERRQQRTV